MTKQLRKTGRMQRQPPLRRQWFRMVLLKPWLHRLNSLLLRLCVSPSLILNIYREAGHGFNGVYECGFDQMALFNMKCLFFFVSFFTFSIEQLQLFFYEDNILLETTLLC